MVAQVELVAEGPCSSAAARGPSSSDAAVGTTRDAVGELQLVDEEVQVVQLVADGPGGFD